MMRCAVARPYSSAHLSKLRVMAPVVFTDQGVLILPMVSGCRAGFCG